MAGDLITADYQMQLGTLLLGAGTAYEVDGDTGLVGWDDLPGLDTADVPRPSAPGEYAGTIYPQARIITVQLSVHGDGPGYAANLATLRAATTATLAAETPLAIRLAGQMLSANVRCLQRSVPTGRNYAASASVKATLQFKATDPRRYGALVTATVAPPSIAGGITWPITWPITWAGGGAGSTGTVNVANSGDYNTPPVITIRGPLTTPAVYRQDTGEVIELNTTMAASDVAVIDVLNDTVTMNGAPAKNLLTDRSAPVSSFLMPGPATTGLALRAAVTDPAASMQVVYAPAYL